MKNISLFIISLFWSFGVYPKDIVDKNATRETKALFHNLKELQSQGKIVLGHQDATLYGSTWQDEDGRSDIKDVTGDHPGLLAMDFIGVTTTNKEQADNEKRKLIKAAKDTYARGGILTFCWHMTNPANGGSFYWEQNKEIAIPEMLKGGKYHEEYNRYLRAVAEVVSQCKGSKGEPIPIIFRPFHEFDGDWFWWGAGHCTREEFIDVWKFTVEYLRDKLKIHNFLYAFSPDCKFTSETEYLDYYPGDEYVDILGMDNYWDFRPDGANNPEFAAKKLKIISDLAQRKGKVAALTETGLEGIPNTVWFTEVLLPVIKSAKLAYVQLWRNAYSSPTHYYAPTKGHPAEADFIKFCKQDAILLESDLPNMYRIK